MISPAVRERYLRDPLSVRLGGLAADLARIASFSDNPRHRDAVDGLLNESKHFAELAAQEASVDIQAQLADVQIMLACWHRRWGAGDENPTMKERAQQWSDRLLAASGLLNE